MIKSIVSIKREALRVSLGLRVDFKAIRIDNDGEIVGFLESDELHLVDGAWESYGESHGVASFDGALCRLRHLNALLAFEDK